MAEAKISLLVLVHSLLMTAITGREIRTMLVQKNTPQNEFGIFKCHPNSNFTRFVENTGLFIDNSLLIKQIYDEDATVVIFHCPRTFGKTLNLKMIKAFYEIEFEPEVGMNITSNMYLFRNGEYVFHGYYKLFSRPLLISNYINFMDQYQGQIPVINLKLTSITFTNGADFKQLFADAIKQTFLEHIYLLDIYSNIEENPNSTWSEKYDARHMRNNFTMFLEAKSSFDELKWSIVFLSKSLAQFFNKSVMLLVDDYDFPLIIAFYNNNLDLIEKQLIIKFLQDFMKITFELGSVEKAVFMGVFEFAQEILFKGCSVTTSVHNFLTDDSYEFFGISRYIADKVFDYIRITLQKRYQGIEWYGGYRLGKTLEIFHPYALVQFKRYRLSKNYFKVSFYPNIFFLHFMEHSLLRGVISSLIQGGNVTIPGSRLTFDKESFDQIYDIYCNPEQKKLQEQHLPAIYSYLLATGYLTFVNQYDVHELPYAENVALKMPNKMIGLQLELHLNSIPQKYT